MKKLLERFIIFCAIAFFLGSCVEEQDFGQYDDLSITPTFEASIIYLETPEDFINGIGETNFYSQEFNFDAFSEDVFSERVIEGTITYQVENTTSKPLDIVIEFLDEGGTILDTETFSIDSAPTAVLIREIAYGNAGRSLDIIRNTSGIRVVGANLGDSDSVSNLPDPRVTLKSSGKFTVRVK